MNRDPNRRKAFKAGDLVLEPDTRRIRIAGRVVEVPRLSYRLLDVLIREAPRVVSSDELIEKVWQNRIVSPETITQRVKLARQAIGDDAKEPKYIGVVWGQGYRFLARVEQIPIDESSFSTNLLIELGRRRILQVALLYAAVAWSITKVLSRPPAATAIRRATHSNRLFWSGILKFLQAGSLSLMILRSVRMAYATPTTWAIRLLEAARIISQVILSAARH